MTNSLDNIKIYLKEYGELRDLEKAAKLRMKELDGIIRPALEGKGLVVAEGYTFELGVTQGRTTYDTKAMLDDGVDLSGYTKTGKPSTRLTIKKVG